MLVYVMAAEGIFAGFINGWYYENPHNTLVRFQSIIKWYSIDHVNHTYSINTFFLSTFVHGKKCPLESNQLKVISTYVLTDILDSEACIRRGVAFKKSWHPTLCHLCWNTILGYHCGHIPQVVYILEALIAVCCWSYTFSKALQNACCKTGWLFWEETHTVVNVH